MGCRNTRNKEKIHKVKISMLEYAKHDRNVIQKFIYVFVGDGTKTKNGRMKKCRLKN